MIKTKKALCLAIAIVVFFTAIASVIIIARNSINSNGGDNEITGDVNSPLYFETASSFFEEKPFVDREDGWDSVNHIFDTYPRTDNTSNFHSHATAEYENINGKTVTVDTLYRNYKEALNDPNYSCGMLIYQCIQYKIAHPDEEVDIAFTSFHTSPTLAVCLNPHSPYFGYVRSLYDRDYDENGFVRVAYLLVEAARMGINVTIVGQLSSYAVTQYNPDTGKTYKKEEPYYVNYFNSAMKYECYDKYAKGDKVSDYMTLRKVEWAYNDKTATDVMHVKTCAVSSYRDKYGFDHDYGVWFSSTNLDAADYKGYNGNGGSQTGVIITNHEPIYNITVNYVELMKEYYEKEAVFEFRNLVKERTREQIYAALDGKADEIPYEERIVYIGGETDKVFEMYFTPLSADFDMWDTTLNPYSKYIQEFYDSDNDQDVVFCFNNPNFRKNFLISDILVEALEYKFITHKRIGNRLGIRCRAQYEDIPALKELKAGKDLEFINIKTKWDAVHEKDIIMSYCKNGERQYISFLSSCNFNANALYYQTNQIIVIRETEQTGNVVYTSIGSKFSKGTIKDEGQGISFSSDDRLQMTEKFDKLPITVSAEIKLDPIKNNTKSYGLLLSNNDLWNLSLGYEINKNGNPQAVFGTLYESKGLKHFKEYACVFDKVNVATGKKLDISFVTDVENAKITCYIDGVAKQTVSVNSAVSLSDDRISVHPYVVGGDHLGSNYNYFRGTMYELSVWSDVRTPEEITQDIAKVKALDDEALMAHYEFYGRTPNTFGGDMSKYDNNLDSIALWLDESVVTDVNDEDYCFAVVPDTQMLSYQYYKSLTDTNSVANVYDWLLANKDEKNIKYVIGVGDITELSVKDEYNNVKEHLYKLSGKLPFSLVMGNHDKYDFQKQGYKPDKMSDFLFNKTFCDDTYIAELDGRYGEGDVSNSYNAFTVGETKWLLLNIDFGPTDEMLNWACDVVEQYPDHKVIVVTHAYLYRDGSTLDANECYPASGHNASFNDGDAIFEKLVKKYENIELVLCGHDPWDHIVCSQAKGESGNTVTQLLIDSQYMDKYYGATEMIALLYFSPDGETMTVRYYSIAKEMYGSILSQFTISLK